MAASATAPDPTLPAGTARTLDLCIAGVRLAFRVAPPFRLSAPRWEYPPFLGTDGADLKLAVEVEVVNASDLVDPLPGTRVFSTGDGWTLDRLDDGRCCFEMREHALGRQLLWRALGHAPFERWLLQCPPPAEGQDRLDYLVQYPLDQVLMTHALQQHDGLLVHAAAVVLDGQAVVFPGVSGAGKSTLARHLVRHPGIEGLSDDRIVLRRHPAEYRAHGTPWAGDARIAAPRSAPLHSLCFITQAPACALRPLPPGEALTRLLPVTTLAWYDEEMLGHGLEICRALLSHNACYELQVPRSGSGLMQALCQHAHAS